MAPFLNFISHSSRLTLLYFYIFFILCTSKFCHSLNCQTILVPAYFDPIIGNPTANYWDKLVGIKNAISIMNPNDGPDATMNTDYNTTITKVRVSGGKVIGYVYTGYGKRNIVDVKSDVAKYFKQYKLDGIFFDEVSDSIVDIKYYQNISAYVRKYSSNNLVVLNPGVHPDEAYIQLADIVVTFEDDFSVYVNSFTKPAYVNNYLASKFSHIVYNAQGSTSMSTALSLSATRNAGNIYITNDVLPNPYDTLPSYFQSESVCSVISSQQPSKVPSKQPSKKPSTFPSSSHSIAPSSKSSSIPSLKSTVFPSRLPTINPTKKSANGSSSCQSLLVPAYFYPTIWNPATNYWDKLVGIKNAISIMNPNDGPDVTMNTDYNTTITKVRVSGGKVIGYVYTGYGKRNIVDVKSDVAKYFKQYKLDGIFFDEVSDSIVDIKYYQNISAYVRKYSSNNLVVLNPGVHPDEAYIQLADIVVTFEDDFSVYVNSFTKPAYVNNYLASKFSHIVYNAQGSTSMSTALSLSATRNAGNIYITNDVLPNPYDTLPSYFQSESVCSVISTQQPSKVPSKQPSNKPTKSPSKSPSFRPSSRPTINPSKKPSLKPSNSPTK